MTGRWWLDALLGVAVAALACWLLLLAALQAVRPRRGLLTEAVRLLPDVLGLVRRLAADPDLPRGSRLGLGLLLAYLASPIDLVPDFIPVLGYVDDAILVTVALRAVIRRAGLEAARRNWRGTADGFAALSQLLGWPRPRPGGSGSPPR